MIRRPTDPFRVKESWWVRRRREMLLVSVALLLGSGLGHLMSAKREAGRKILQRTRPLMGTLVDVQIEDSGAGLPAYEAAFEAAFAEFSRIERVFSPYSRNSGPATAAESLEVQTLLELGRRVGSECGGALDLRLRDLVDLWGFEHQPRLPSNRELDSLNEVRRRRPEGGSLEEYTFGAVAKGYAVDRAIAVLRETGVKRALVNAGGEIRALGGGWQVGIQHPREARALIASFTLPETSAVATSGDYEHVFEQDGRSYHHVLNPASGMPATGCQSVTVTAPTCAEADIWATALFVMGSAAALAVVSRHPELEILLVDAAGYPARSAGWMALEAKEGK